jgi:hypothetical protein
MSAQLMKRRKATRRSFRPDATGLEARCVPSALLTIRVHAVQVSDDDGLRACDITPAQVSQWVDEANEVYSVADLEFDFNQSRDWSTLRSTTINNMAGDTDPNWTIERDTANAEGARYPGELVAFFRHGPGSVDPGGGFSGSDLNFVAMPGFNTPVAGHQNIGLFAHEAGHYLGLAHTFPTKKAFDTLADAQAYFSSHGYNVGAFDGDGLSDTLSDPMVKALTDSHPTSVTLRDAAGRNVVIPVPYDNIMTYWDNAYKTLTPQQISRVRDVAETRIDFPVNTTTEKDQDASDNASSSNGISVVVWVHVYSSTDHDIYGQLYDASGKMMGSQFAIDASFADEREPAVAMDGQGNFVVTWTRTTGGNSNVMAARYSSQGIPSGVIFAVADSIKPEHDPDVAMDSAGNFIVSYTLDYSATNQDILVNRYLANGTLARTISVARTTNNESRSSIAAAPDGRFDIAYQYQYSSTDDDVYLRRYDASGSPLDPWPLLIATSGYVEQAPSVSMDNSGNAVVAYFKKVGTTSYIKAARVSGNNGTVSGEISVAQATSPAYLNSPSVALRRTGGAFVVAYEFGSVLGDPAVRVTEVSSSNTITATSSTRVVRFAPEISIGRFDAYLVTYTSRTSVDLNISGRRGHIFELLVLPVSARPFQPVKLANGRQVVGLATSPAPGSVGRPLPSDQERALPTGPVILTPSAVLRSPPLVPRLLRTRTVPSDGGTARWAKWPATFSPLGQ